ncbi:MAG: class I SAM-dependent methyltransferase, partial [Anaerolineales bacterium]|nr:class I SAM-dependent methyltransferase [Anaerolineales bacterium]
MSEKQPSWLARIIDLNGIRKKCAERALKHNLASFNKPALYDQEDFSKHFADEETADIGLQYVIKSFIIDRINFIENVLSKEEIENDNIMDLGDSSGIFLKAFDKKSLGVNISKEAVVNIKGKGIDSVLADGARLPFKDKQIDHVLFFQIFEHAPNPINTLKEINRVCKKSVILSIPHVSRTIIHKHNYDPTIPIFQHHIFEFSDDDFRKIVTHAGLKVSSAKTVEVFDSGKNLRDIFVYAMWRLFREKDMFCGCFSKFTIYHLVKDDT